MKCPKCGAEMYREYLFTRFSEDAEWFHFVCPKCGYEGRYLYRNLQWYEIEALKRKAKKLKEMKV